MTHGVNETSIFSVDPRSADTFLLPDTSDSGADEAPYDVRGHDEITILVDNGADQAVEIVIETFAFNDEAATTAYGPVTDKEGVDTTTIAAGDAEPVSIGVGALAFIQVAATYGTAPASGTLTVTYQSDHAGSGGS